MSENLEVSVVKAFSTDFCKLYQQHFGDRCEFPIANLLKALKRASATDCVDSDVIDKAMSEIDGVIFRLESVWSDLSGASIMYPEERHTPDVDVFRSSSKRLAIIMGGGLINAIVSDDPDQFDDIDIAIVDYDTEGCADSQVTHVPDLDGTSCKAVIDHDVVSHAQINLDYVFAQW